MGFLSKVAKSLGGGSGIGGLIGGITGGLFGGSGGAVAGSQAGSEIGSFFGPSDERLQRREDLYWYNKQRDDAIAAWNMQNDYNSPTAQMARLKAAGLNPMLVYGSGDVTGNTSGSISGLPEGRSTDIIGNRTRREEAAATRQLKWRMQQERIFASQQHETNELDNQIKAAQLEGLQLKNKSLQMAINSGMVDGPGLYGVSVKDQIDLVRLSILQEQLDQLENNYGNGNITNINTWRELLGLRRGNKRSKKSSSSSFDDILINKGSGNLVYGSSGLPVSPWK